MLTFTLLIIIFIILLLLEGIYCRIAKKHYMAGRTHDTEKTNNRKTMKILIGFAGDFVYMTFKMVGYLPSHTIRKLFYKYIFCMNIGEKCVIYFGLEARSPWNISIGEGSIIGDHAIFDARCGISIGNNVNISSGVWIWSLQHDVNSIDFNSAGKSVIIDDRAWVSSRVSILPGCHIHEGCVIACGAVLTKSTNDKFMVYGGVPAKCISKRNNQIRYEFDGSHRIFL